MMALCAGIVNALLMVEADKATYTLIMMAHAVWARIVNACDGLKQTKGGVGGSIGISIHFTISTIRMIIFYS